jgi:hypothetical protein
MPQQMLWPSRFCAVILDWIQVATDFCCLAVNGLRICLRSYRASDVVPISL